jgi:hypothetical protein
MLGSFFCSHHLPCRCLLHSFCTRRFRPFCPSHSRLRLCLARFCFMKRHGELPPHRGRISSSLAL